jgi:hypothetical protein
MTNNKIGGQISRSLERKFLESQPILIASKIALTLFLSLWKDLEIDPFHDRFLPFWRNFISVPHFPLISLSVKHMFDVIDIEMSTCCRFGYIKSLNLKREIK